MLEFTNKWSDLIIKNSDKKEIILNKETFEVLLDWFDVTFPWEYEKSWILLEVKEYNEKLFYSFQNEWNHIVIITHDNFELKEEILTFFWDVDILIIIWTKDAAKVFENIEAKMVIPFWEGKEIFLNTLWQHKEEEESFKLKSELDWETTEFVNLK